HMRSKKKVLGKLMDLTNFIPLHIWGANINRRTIENLEKAGFKKEAIEKQDLWSDIVKFIVIKNIKNEETE
ncbi:MAG: SAM-dependent methyltransferase, partial [Bacillota bacterium]